LTTTRPLTQGEKSSQQSIGDELDIEHLKPDLKAKIKEFEKSRKEQQILLKENKQNIIDFLLGNKESIRIEI
jgi:hypothetical protein